MGRLLSKVGRSLSRRPEVRNPRLFALFYLFFGCALVALGYFQYLNSVTRAQTFEARFDVDLDTQRYVYSLLASLVLGLANVTLAARYALPDFRPRASLGLSVVGILLILAGIVFMVLMGLSNPVY